MKYELIDANTRDSLGTVWLEDGKLKGSSPSVLQTVRRASVQASSDAALFKLLPKAFRSGYITVKRIDS